MKHVQILMDESLLGELDSDPDVQLQGRSKVLRELVKTYLRQRREAAYDAQYASGYGDGVHVSEELAGWDEEAEWPEK